MEDIHRIVQSERELDSFPRATKKKTTYRLYYVNAFTYVELNLTANSYSPINTITPGSNIEWKVVIRDKPRTDEYSVNESLSKMEKSCLVTAVLTSSPADVKILPGRVPSSNNRLLV